MRGAHGRRVPVWVRAGRGRAAALLVAAVGLLLVGGASVGMWQAQQGVAEVGGDRVADLAAPSEPAPTGRPDRPVVTVTDGRALPSDSTVPPTSLRIPAIGLTAQVDQVGINSGTGDFDVPPSVDRVGWYRFGPGLETGAGSVVIAGHVDSAAQGRGAFFRLSELSPGDLIEVSDADGVTHHFEVVGREVYGKDTIPLERYFARDGEVRLTLITCGGEFDGDAGRYEDNVVVTAAPVG
jgi:hypothetical protein